MTIYLLIIIYVIFISLGLPDSIIGGVWPSLAASFNVPPDWQGFVTITISLCTILSSFVSLKLIKYIKPKYVITFSILLTAVGILCFGLSSEFYFLILSCIPFGLGAGAIDTLLNNYVALHYKAVHMNFLHAFWGVGTVLSPLILSAFLTSENESWRKGIIALSIIQSVIFLIALANIWVWNKADKIFNKFEHPEEKEEEKITLGFFNTFRIKGVWFAIIGFFSYIAVESLSGFWFSSFVTYGLHDKFVIDAAQVATWTSLFYVGITLGRFSGGLLSFKINDRNRIRIGVSIIFVGIVLLFTTSLEAVTNITYLQIILPVSVFLLGFGCGPIYPAIIHDTPNRFTPKLSQNVMSVQISCSYIANITIAPLFGVIGDASSFLLLPLFILIFLILVILGNELVQVKTKDKNSLLVHINKKV